MKYNLNFFTSDKSGKYSKIEYVKKHHTILYEKIINFKTDIQPISFKDRIYLFATNNNVVPKCLTCNKPLTIKDSLNKGFPKYCNINCMNKNETRKETIKNNYNKKYGVDSHNQIEIIKQKKKTTYIKKYGVDNPMKCDNIKLKQKKSLIKKYGVDNPMKIISVIENKELNLKNLTEKNLKRMIDRIPSEYKIISYEKRNIKLFCPNCEKAFIINSNLLNARINLNKTICINCNDIKTNTDISKKLKIFLNELNIKYIENDRNVIKPLELDFYLPDYSLGIEINGLYWHSELFKNKIYHLNKTEKCEKQKIKLLHFFEDEIIEKFDIVKSIIKSKLGLIDNKIYARKCEIKDLNNNIKYNKIIKEFLNKNHIQGFIDSKYKIGLFYNNELVSLMTFGKSRKNTNHNKNYQYELSRFCNKLNTTVIGGASKLLKYFINLYKPKSIISLANRRYSDGNLYQQLEFDLKNKSIVGYYYIKPGEVKRHYRFKFRKDVLVKEGYNPNKTEHEIMLERGYLRIYDCGNYVYEKYF